MQTCSFPTRYSRYAFYDLEFHNTNKHSIYSQHFDESQLATKTKLVQKYIFEHQNPKDCQKAKYLTALGFDVGGLGAEILGLASQLSYALTHGYVLVWAKTNMTSKYYNGTAECKNLGFSCIFQPLSQCESKIQEPDEKLNEIFNLFLIPPQIESLLYKHNPAITHAQALYWWKAQSVAYIMRLNENTLESITKMRKTSSMHISTNNYTIPFPLPGGTVSMHIRRGNKIPSEMDPVPVENYITGYHILTSQMPLGFSKRWVHVMSDTLSPIMEAQEILESKQGHTSVVLYSRLPRQETGWYYETWNNFIQNSTHATHMLLMELLMSLEADSWVGTRISTWGRIVDMLRCVWVDKCQGMYMEVGSLTQNNEPDQHMYFEFVVPRHAKTYGKQKNIWPAPESLFQKK